MMERATSPDKLENRMNNFSLLIDLIGSLEPTKWISPGGIKAGPYAALLLCGYVFLRDGMRRGAWSIAGYVVRIAVVLSLISAI